MDWIALLASVVVPLIAYLIGRRDLRRETDELRRELRNELRTEIDGLHKAVIAHLNFVRNPGADITPVLDDRGHLSTVNATAHLKGLTATASVGTLTGSTNP